MQVLPHSRDNRRVPLRIGPKCNLAKATRVATAKPTGKENGGMGGDSGPHGREEKLSSPLRHSVLMPVPVYFVHSAVTRGVAKASPALHRHRGGPNCENAPALTPGRGLHSLERRLAHGERKQKRYIPLYRPNTSSIFAMILSAHRMLASRSLSVRGLPCGHSPAKSTLT